jgi:hypothetical protein
MGTTKFDVVLDASAPDFAKRFAEALGVKPGETLQIVTPQFKRTDGLQVPLLQVSFSNLPMYDEATLKAIGCQKWDEPNAEGETLWLFPHEWYDIIPDGTPIVDINGEHNAFKHGETDDDMRYGALAYGFIRREPQP